MFSKIVKYSAGMLAALFIVIQFFQPAHTNPPSNPAASFESVMKPSPEMAATFERACRDCHSNETVWPWYSRVAPVSWLVVNHVNEGRARLNLSDWTRPNAEGDKQELGELCEQMQAGKMPLRSYRLLHPEARLTRDQITAVCGSTLVNE